MIKVLDRLTIFFFSTGNVFTCTYILNHAAHVSFVFIKLTNIPEATASFSYPDAIFRAVPREGLFRQEFMHSAYAGSCRVELIMQCPTRLTRFHSSCRQGTVVVAVMVMEVVMTESSNACECSNNGAFYNVVEGRAAFVFRSVTESSTR